MQPEAARIAETRDWLGKAALDLRAAEFDLTAQPPLTADILFHAQQLAEKALKAFLVNGHMFATLPTGGDGLRKQNAYTYTGRHKQPNSENRR